MLLLWSLVVGRSAPAIPAQAAASGGSISPMMLLPPSRDDPSAMSAWFSQIRVLPGARYPTEKYVRARSHAATMLANARARGLLPQVAPGAIGRRWTFLGPDDEGGRTRALVINRTNPKVMYTGGVSGGVWKSTDAGASWKPLARAFGNVFVSSIAMDPRDPKVLYVGTGEVLSNRNESSRGIGILKTTDAGASWALLPSTEAIPAFAGIHDLVISSNDSQRIYAGTVAGVMRSLDGGTTWERVLKAATRGGCADLVIRTDRNPDHLFASCSFYRHDGVYRSIDGGDQWEKVIGQVEGVDSGFAALALAPSNQDVIYASIAQAYDSAHPGEFKDSTLALVRSTGDGANGTWTLQNSGGWTPGHPNWLNYCGDDSGQGNYANAIAVDPTDPNRLWVAGADAYRSENGGKTLRIGGYWWPHQVYQAGNGSQYLHADHHLIVYDPRYDGKANQQVYFATDGGLFRTRNDRAALTHGSACNYGLPLSTLNQVRFDAINHGYAATQFWAGAVSADGQILMGGTQDNGTFLRPPGAGPSGWIQVQGGDGFKVAIAPSRDSFLAEYYGSEGIAMTRSSTGAFGSFVTITESLKDVGLFVTPFALDAKNPEVVWTGGHTMWRSTNHGGVWVAASPELTLPPGDERETGISAITIAPSDDNVVYAANTTGQVYVTTNGLSTPPTWTNITGSLPTGPDAFVSAIAVHPTDPRTIYVTHSFFGVAHVWRSTDGGSSWTDVNGDLPDVPVSALAIDPLNTQMIFLGTDVGVFESPDSGATWLPANGTMQSTIIQDLLFRPGTSELYAFTYGRGAYRLDVGSGS